MTLIIPVKALKLAVENGWRPSADWGHNERCVISRAPHAGILINWQDNRGKPHFRSIETLALDPTFWQALGKALGWGRLHCIHCRELAKPVRENESDPEYWHDCCKSKKLEYGKSWKLRASDFYDLILTGGDTEKFWQELLVDYKPS